MLQQAAVLFETKRKMYYNIIDKSIEPDPNGAYLRDIVLILKNQWPRKHTENTEYSQIISVSSVDSVDSVAIYHDFDLVSAIRIWPIVST